jgi:beta-lactamase regulating signal transducer with metallopeptidase domain
MALVMIYLIAISAISLVALRLAEQAGWLFRQPTRLIWLAGVWSLVVFTLSQTLPRHAAPGTARSSVAPTVSPTASMTGGAAHDSRPSMVDRFLPRLTSRTAAMLQASSDALPGWARALDATLLALWLALSMGIALSVGLSIVHSSLARRQWASTELDQVPVLMSERTGPLVVGVVRRRIVLPRWVFDLSLHERTLVLAHEQEHARRADPALAAFMFLALILVPWNPVLWAMRRRFALAMEVDCDRRVLSAHDAVHSYGALLLTVAERGVGMPAPAAMFARRSELRARLERMLTGGGRPMHWADRWSRAGVFLVLSVALVGVACVAPRPQPMARPDDRVRQLSVQLIDALAADSATLVQRPATADRISLQRHLERFLGADSAHRSTRVPSSDMARTRASTLLHEVALPNRAHSDSALAVLHAWASATAAQDARIASVLRSDPRFSSADSSAVPGGPAGTLWILASADGVITGSKRTADTDDIIDAERVAREFPQVSPHDVRSVSVMGGAAAGVPYARVVWGVVAR